MVPLHPLHASDAPLQPAILATPDLALKAIFSRSIASARTLAVVAGDGVSLYADDIADDQNYAALLQRSDVVAVVVALPIPVQPAFVHAALVAGKHVLSEKPVAPDVRRASELLEWYHSAIDAAKVSWAVAENYRFLQTTQRAREEIQRLGRLLGFHVRVQSRVEPGGKYFGTLARVPAPPPPDSR